MTQLEWTRRKLLSGETLSHPTAIAADRGWRLGAHVHRLRHKHGWPIETRRGERGVAHYRLLEGWKPTESGAEQLELL